MAGMAGTSRSRQKQCGWAGGWRVRRLGKSTGVSTGWWWPVGSGRAVSLER